MNAQPMRTLLRGLADFCLRGSPLSHSRRLRDLTAGYRESPSFSDPPPRRDVLEAGGAQHFADDNAARAPGYATAFFLYPRDHFALPGEWAPP